jgi:polysaccharide biosynthesis/export protein
VNRLTQLGLGALLIAISLVSGCFSSDPNDIRAFVKPYEVDVTAEDYIFQPPDDIEIHCTQVPEVHLQVMRIRPDGMISFEGLGEIYVAGKTPGEVAEILTEKITVLYALPGDNAVDVRVAAYASKLYYVAGQVAVPGPKVYTGRDSVMTAVSSAQPNALAWESRVRVIRPSAHEDQRPRIFEVNYVNMRSKGDMSKDVLLEEGDIIFVPPTILGAIGLLVEEIITPVARAFYGVNLVQNPPGSDRYSPYGGGGGGYGY